MFGFLYSGATHHVCCDRSKFSSILPTSNSSVSLPNGHKVSIEFIGIVTVLEGLTHSNVLFIPNFKFNLISISSLVSHHPISMTFMPDSCTHTEDWNG